jgi:hypothetical protein
MPVSGRIGDPADYPEQETTEHAPPSAGQD